MAEKTTSGQRRTIGRLCEDAITSDFNLTKEQAQERIIEKGDEFQAGFRDFLTEFTKSKYAHLQTESNYGYPREYSPEEGVYLVKPLEEQAEVLRSYDFPVKPIWPHEIAVPETAEGLALQVAYWDIAPSDCEHPYNYAVDFVWERVPKAVKQDKFYHYREGKTGHRYLVFADRSDQMFREVCKQQDGYTPVMPFQFGIKYRGKAVLLVRELFSSDEFGNGSVGGGQLLITHPERTQSSDDLYIDFPGDEYSYDGDGDFGSAPCASWDETGLHFSAYGTDDFYGNDGSLSLFLPQTNLES